MYVFVRRTFDGRYTPYEVIALLFLSVAYLHSQGNELQVELMQSAVYYFTKQVRYEHVGAMLHDRSKLLGGLRIGWKDLYVSSRSGKYTRRRVMCVLDFYVHESMQRKGIGRQLFEVRGCG